MIDVLDFIKIKNFSLPKITLWLKREALAWDIWNYVYPIKDLYHELLQINKWKTETH